MVHHPRQKPVHETISQPLRTAATPRSLLDEETVCVSTARAIATLVGNTTHGEPRARKHTVVCLGGGTPTPDCLLSVSTHETARGWSGKGHQGVASPLQPTARDAYSPHLGAALRYIPSSCRRISRYANDTHRVVETRRAIFRISIYYSSPPNVRYPSLHHPRVCPLGELFLR